MNTPQQENPKNEKIYPAHGENKVTTTQKGEKTYTSSQKGGKVEFSSKTGSEFITGGTTTTGKTVVVDSTKASGAKLTGKSVVVDTTKATGHTIAGMSSTQTSNSSSYMQKGDKEILKINRKEAGALNIAQPKTEVKITQDGTKQVTETETQDAIIHETTIESRVAETDAPVLVDVENSQVNIVERTKEIHTPIVKETSEMVEHKYEVEHEHAVDHLHKVEHQHNIDHLHNIKHEHLVKHGHNVEHDHKIKHKHIVKHDHEVKHVHAVAHDHRVIHEHEVVHVHQDTVDLDAIVETEDQFDVSKLKDSEGKITIKSKVMSTGEEVKVQKNFESSNQTVTMSSNFVGANKTEYIAPTKVDKVIAPAQKAVITTNTQQVEHFDSVSEYSEDDAEYGDFSDSAEESQMTKTEIKGVYTEHGDLTAEQLKQLQLEILARQSQMTDLPSEMDISNRSSFIYQFAPKGHFLKCRIERAQNQGAFASKFKTAWHVYLSKDDSYLMTGMQQGSNFGDKFLVTTNANMEFDEKNVSSRITSNMIGSNYRIFDGGEKYGKNVPSQKTRSQIGVVVYVSQNLISRKRIF